MKVDGYDYPAFLRAVAALRGRGCWVRGLLEARRREWLAARAPGAGMPWDLDPGLLVCDGEMDAHHVGIPKQRLKREYGTKDFPLFTAPVAARQPSGPIQVWWVDLAAMLMDPRNGVLACRRHHDLLERRLVVPVRAELPVGVEGFAAEVGMVWSLERDYGTVESEAA